MGILQSILSRECFEDLILNGDFLNVGCIQLLLSRLIGFSIVLLCSVFMKLPQVIKILYSRSAEGVSFSSQFLMLITTSSTISYSLAKDYPFSTWGESIALGIQTLAICVLILIYKDYFKEAVLFMACYFVCMLLLLSIASMNVLYGLQLLSLPLSVMSKWTQIQMNYSRKSTGQLSATYVLLMSCRSMGRLYTNVTETGDTLRIATFLMACFLNTLLGCQLLYYRGICKYRRKLKKG